MAARNTQTHNLIMHTNVLAVSCCTGTVHSNCCISFLSDLSGQATYESLLTSERTRLELSYEQLSPKSLSLLDPVDRRHYVQPPTLQSCELNISRPRWRAGYQRTSHVTDGRCCKRAYNGAARWYREQTAGCCS